MHRPSVLLAVFMGMTVSGCGLFKCQFGRSADPDEQCSLAEEKERVYEILRDQYLFASQVPDLELDTFSSSEAVLARVVESVTPPDRFSFLQSRATSDRAEAGIYGGFGVRLAWWPGQGLLLTRVFGTFAPEPPTAASEAGLRRGDVIIEVEGEAIGALEVNEAVERLGPDELGVERRLRLRRPSGEEYEVTVSKRPYQRHTAPVVRDLGQGVGYLLFDAFLERSEEELDEAFRALRDAGVRRLVLDLRWNGGGRGSTSRRLLGLMLGAQHNGAPAYSLEFNEDYEDCRVEHEIERQDASLAALEQVVIITGPGTASASELVWNVLRPYVRVQTVGAPSVGKPFGFYPYDLCGKVLRATNYRRENAARQAVPVEGIAPDCASSDQVAGPLGDPADNLLSAALDLLEGRPCLQPAWIGPQPEALELSNRQGIF